MEVNLFQLKRPKEFLDETYLPLNYIFGMYCLFNEEQSGFLSDVQYDAITNTHTFTLVPKLKDALVFSHKAALIAVTSYKKLGWDFTLIPISAFEYHKQPNYDGSLN